MSVGARLAVDAGSASPDAYAGLFGKLPARGDFVRESLPRDFTDAWDAWWQRSLAGTQQRPREEWIASWLEAPVWRFVLPPALCGKNGVLGIWLPSVDKAGRYSPLTIAAVASIDWAPHAGTMTSFLAAAEQAGRDALEYDLSRPNSSSASARASCDDAPASRWISFRRKPRGGPRAARESLHAWRLAIPSQKDGPLPPSSMTIGVSRLSVGVVVIGNAGLDLRLGGAAPAAAGRNADRHRSARAPGGKGLNQAVVAARCGARVRFCAPLGNDEAQAREVERQSATRAFDGLVLPRLPHPTDFSLLMVLPGGENSIVSTSACSLALGFAAVEPALRDLGGGDVVLLQGNLSLDVTAAILAAARRCGATTIFNPAPFWPGAEKLLSHCSLVIANRLEAEALGVDRSRPPPLPSSRWAPTAVASPVAPSRPSGWATVDSTGCGDTFCGVMAAALGHGLALEPAIGRAQKAAAITATRAGAFEALPSRGELAALFAG